MNTTRVSPWPGSGSRARQTAAAFALLALSPCAIGARIEASPADYRDHLARLKAGDELVLAPGLYQMGLPVHGLEGSAARPIVIRAADPARRPRFIARSGVNTVSIVDSAHVTLRGLVLEGNRTAVDAVKAEGHARFAHHVRIEDFEIRGHDQDQQNVAISTKCPAFGWVIRGTLIDGAGTGLYLGNSDGSAPFVGGLIENNVIRNTIGYNLQIKHQAPRPGGVGLPDSPQVTVIRGNRFSKSTGSSSGEMARPNVLLGHLPLSGTGTDDRYLVYANRFDGNPSESLLQAEGNVAVYANLFVNRDGPGIRIRPHNDRPRWVAIFANTVVTAGPGITTHGEAPGYRRHLLHNAVFALDAIRSAVTGNNFTAAYDADDRFLEAPRADLPQRSYRPRAGRLAGAGMLPEELAALPAADRDLTGRPRTAGVHGACEPPEPGETDAGCR